MNSVLSSTAVAQTWINGVINLNFKMNDFSTSNLHQSGCPVPPPCAPTPPCPLCCNGWIVALPSYPFLVWHSLAQHDIRGQQECFCEYSLLSLSLAASSVSVSMCASTCSQLVCKNLKNTKDSCQEGMEKRLSSFYQRLPSCYRIGHNDHYAFTHWDSRSLFLTVGPKMGCLWAVVGGDVAERKKNKK